MNSNFLNFKNKCVPYFFLLKIFMVIKKNYFEIDHLAFFRKVGVAETTMGDCYRQTDRDAQACSEHGVGEESRDTTMFKPVEERSLFASRISTAI